MNDEPILEYLRARGRATPPASLVDDVHAVLADAPQPSRLWLARLVPMAAALGGACAVLILAVLFVGGGDRDATAQPTMTGAPTATVGATAAPTSEGEAGSLIEKGDTVTFAAVDSDGEWGTISLRRGADVGGYLGVAGVDLDPRATDPSPLYFQNDPGRFYVEVFAQYRPEPGFAATGFGVDDWRLEGTRRSAEIQPLVPLGLAWQTGPQPQLGTFAATTVDNGVALEGWMVFAVPRDMIDATAWSLIYDPAGTANVRVEIPVREPNPAPAPVASVVPPRAANYISVAGLPITVAESVAADALFAAPDACTNPMAGYTVTFPDSWWTNTEIGDTPACTWFSPTFFEVTDPTQTPEGVVIEIGFIEEAGGIGGLGHGLHGESLVIGGLPSGRSEQVGVGGGFIPIGSFTYQYVVTLEGELPSEDNSASVLIASTDWQIDEEPSRYELDRAVLDRIMASLEVLPRE